MAAKFNFKSLGEPFEADWPVSVPVPQDGGEVETQTFTARFRLLSKEDLEDAVANAKDAFEIQRRVWVGFGKDETMTLTQELFDQGMATPYFRVALMEAYQRFSQGIASKN